MKILNYLSARLLILLLLTCGSFASFGQATILINQGGTVPVSDGDMFYDAGGAAGNDGNTNYTITLTPAVAGEYICVDFTSFISYYSASSMTNNDGDSLCIYDGTTATTAIKMATLMGDYGSKWNSSNTPTTVGAGAVTAQGTAATTSPGIFCSTTGSLTFSWYGGRSSQAAGWVARVTTYKPLGIPGCNVNITASPNPICKNSSTTLTVTGNVVAAAINNDFNTGVVGTGWQGTGSVTFQDNATTYTCLKPSIDNSKYIWMASQACPRTLTSVAMDVTNGGTVSFDYRQADNNQGGTFCEAPDIGSTIGPESVFLQYSTNGGTTWTTMKVMFPSDMLCGTCDAYPGIGYETKNWKKIVTPIPAGAKGATTQFRWIMPVCSSASTDNWGLDNVVIASPKPMTVTIKDGGGATVGSSTTTPYTLSVTPTTTTTYTATISDGTTSCTSTVTVTVNDATVISCGTPTASSCTFNWTNTGAASYNYSWIKNGAGAATTGNTAALTLTISSLNPGDYIDLTITPAGSTCPTTFRCSAGSCVMPTANAGSAGTISCTQNTSGYTIGAASVGGVTYAWTSNPAGFTSATSNPSVTPTITTTYTLSASSTGTCIATNSVVVTVDKALPTANAGSAGTISCSLNTAGYTIGVASVAGTTYAWTSNPAGYTSTTANPSVTPTITTTYTLVATKTSSGCTANNTVEVVVDKTLPTANAGSPGTISCTVNSSGYTIGAAAIAGTTYSWTSNPAGFTSTTANPLVTPTISTTYTLVATKTSSGCTASSSVVVTVSGSVPSANAGSAGTISCSLNTSGYTIGAASVAGNTYSWISNPAGFTSTTSNPLVTPTISTTYTITANNTASGCSASNTVVVTVDKTLPTADAGSAGTISCSLNTSGYTIGAAAIAGTTYSWTSNPAGFTNTTSNPSVTPTITTTYSLVATKTSSGCTASSSVIVTVNKTLPTANAGSPGTISCTLNTSGYTIGVAGVAGTTYSWTSNPAGFTSTTANPLVNPTVTTTYSLVATNTASGCTASNSVIVSVSGNVPSANAGSAGTISCSLNSAGYTIGAASVGGNTYSWTSNPAGFTSATANPLVTPTVTTTYTLVATNTISGCSASNSVIVTYNKTTPTAAAGADFTKSCTQNSSGASVGSAAIAGETYAWLPSTGLSANNISAPFANPSSSITYTLTTTNTASGCTSSDQVAVTVSGAVPAASAGNDATISCTLNLTGVPLGVTSVAGITYAWTPNTNLSASNISNPTATPTVSTTYILNVTDNVSGCTSSDQVIVSVDKVLPIVTVAKSNDITCYNITATLSGTVNGSATPTGGPYAYVWTVDGNATTLGSTLSPSAVSAPGTYALSVTNSSNGCTNTNSIVISQTTPPPAANAGTDGTICAGKSTTLTATGVTTSGNYKWSNSINAASQSVSPTPTSTIITNTTYTVTVSEGTNPVCTATDAVVITVNPIPLPVITPTLPAVCVGVSTDLTASVTNASGSTPSYDWSTISTATTITVTPLIATSYTVTATLNGCSNTAVLGVNINPGVTIIANPPSVCPGKTATLTASGGVQYLWSNGLPGNQAVTVTPAQSTTYTVTVTNATSCSASASIPVVVYTNPTVSITGQTPICSGASTTLTAATTTQDGLTTISSYAWSNSANPPVPNILTVSPMITTNYQITVTDNHTCTASNFFDVTVNPTPIAKATVAPTGICLGDQAQLGVTGGRLATSIYQWQSTASLSNANISNPTTTPTATGQIVYSVTISDEGCPSTDQVILNVYAIPIAEAGVPQQICAGVQTPLTATGGTTYKWSNGDNNATTLVTPLANSTYSVTVSANGCSSSDFVTVDVNPAPTVNFTSDNDGGCEPWTINFTDNSQPNLASFLWNFGDLSSSALQNPPHEYLNDGTYDVSLKVTDAIGCTNTKTKLGMIIIHPQPTVDFSWNPVVGEVLEGKIDFSPLTSGGVTKYEWNFGDSTSNSNTSIISNPWHRYLNAAYYTVNLIGTTNFGCVDFISHQIRIKEVPAFYIANAFTPTGDGVNDKYGPVFVNYDLSQYEFTIYDRWGEKVFQTTNIEEYWNGKMGGTKEQVKTDVYVWKITFAEKEGKIYEYRGKVTVVN